MALGRRDRSTGDHPDNYGRESYFNPMVCRNGVFKKFAGYCSDVFTEGAIDFIRSNKDVSWFAYVAFNAPHTPLQIDPGTSAACAARGATGDLPALYAMVENIDANVGRLLAVLEGEGLRKDTVVVFTSDHGPCPSVRDGEGRPRFNAGLRGEKGSVYEGGIRVPCLWSGRLTGGGVFQEPTHAIDVAPTFLSMAGVDIPADMDGVDLQPLFEGNGLGERMLFLQWHRGDVPIPCRNATAVASRWKWVSVSEGSTGELYDVVCDPGEEHDMADTEPDVLKSLREAYLEWYRDVSGTHCYAAVVLLLESRSLPLRLTRQDWRVEGADGWDASTKAHWVLRVVEAGTYQVVVRFDTKPEERGTVVLDVGGRRYVQEAMAGCGEYVFRAEFTQGDTTLRAGWQTNFREGSPFAVVIDRGDS